MAYLEAFKTISQVAAVDLSAKANCFVQVSTDGLHLAGDGQIAHGVLLDDPKITEQGNVGISGVLAVKCGAAIAKGAQVASGANGLAKTAATGNVILGVAMEAASGANSIIAVLFQPRGAAA